MALKNETMKDIALLTVLFDYPEYYQPIYYNNGLKYFNKEDIYVARFNNLVQGGSYYDKLYKYKIVYLLDFIKEKLLNYKYIIFSDATDTNFYRDPSNIVNDFTIFNCNILFCSEINLWPPINESQLYNNKPKLSPYMYLNSGLYMGLTEHIIKHLENIITKDFRPYDDQAVWAIEYLLSEDIKLDQERKIFFSTLDSKDDIIIEDNKHTIKTNPYMIHDNGPFNEKTIKLSQIL